MYYFVCVWSLIVLHHALTCVLCPHTHKTGLRIGRGWGEEAEDAPDEEEEEQEQLDDDDDDDDDDDALGLKPLGRGGRRRGRGRVGSRRRGGQQQEEQEQDGEEGAKGEERQGEGAAVTVAALPNVCFSSALALLQLGRGEGAFLGVCLGVVDG